MHNNLSFADSAGLMGLFTAYIHVIHLAFTVRDVYRHRWYVVGLSLAAVCCLIGIAMTFVHIQMSSGNTDCLTESPIEVNFLFPIQPDSLLAMSTFWVFWISLVVTTLRKATGAWINCRYPWEDRTFYQTLTAGWESAGAGLVSVMLFFRLAEFSIYSAGRSVSEWLEDFSQIATLLLAIQPNIGAVGGWVGAHPGFRD